MKVAIIGAGMAGLTCAAQLAIGEAHDVHLFDKGSRPSGRMSARWIGNAFGRASFDIGAQYFTIRDPVFAEQVALWKEQGLVACWPAAGLDAYVGTPTMSAPIEALAARQRVSWHAQIDRLERHDRQWSLQGAGIAESGFDIVVLAMPAEQAVNLLRPWDAEMAAIAERTKSQPCWTSMMAFAGRLEISADIFRSVGVIGWAARNSAKPGRVGLESWVVQAGPEWSLRHLDHDAPDIIHTLRAAFADLTKTPIAEPVIADVHRWRYARSGNAGRDCLWNPASGLGVCGDWLLGPRVESAFLSGFRLAALIQDFQE